MERGTRLFWVLIAVLLGAAVYFGVNAESRRRALAQSTGSLATGDVVQLERVIDGDSVVVTGSTGGAVSVRILGIKTFEPQPEREPTARYGKSAIDEIERLTRGRPMRVMLHATPEDDHGRTLATLFVADEDLGLALVESGLALVYTRHPFPAMPLYLAEQQAARSNRRGLWADADATRRAELLAHEWQQESR